MEYFINRFPLFDILLIIFLFVGIIKKEKSFPFITFFFIYSIFHYSYTVPAILTKNTSLLVDFHNSSNIMAIVSLAIFLCSWIILVVLKCKDKFINPTFIQKHFMGTILFFSILFLIPYIDSPILTTDVVSLKNSISILLMLMLSYLFFILIQGRSYIIPKKSLNILAVSSFLALLIASFEVFHGFSWAMGLLPNGQLFARASSTMMNPNVFGLYGVFLILFGSFLKDQENTPKISLTFLPMGSIILYLTGSRSAFLFGLLLLVTISSLKCFIGIRWTKAFRQTAILMASFYAICIAGNFYGGTAKPLSMRFLDLPKNIVNLMNGSKTERMFLLSVKGRLGIPDQEELNNEESQNMAHYDNAYLAIKSNSTFALIIWVAAIIILMAWSLRVFWRKKSLHSVYALTSLVAFISIGFLLRAYQVFPVLGAAALLLAIVLAWLTEETAPNVRNC